MNFLQRAAVQLPLNPAERAALKFIKGLVVSAMLAGLAVVYPTLANGATSPPNWNAVIATFMSAFLMTIYQTIEKWFTSHEATVFLSSAAIDSEKTPVSIIPFIKQP